MTVLFSELMKALSDETRPLIEKMVKEGSQILGSDGLPGGKDYFVDITTKSIQDILRYIDDRIEQAVRLAPPGTDTTHMEMLCGLTIVKVMYFHMEALNESFKRQMLRQLLSREFGG